MTLISKRLATHLAEKGNRAITLETHHDQHVYLGK
jgi:hypothetical protein